MTVAILQLLNFLQHVKWQRLSSTGIDFLSFVLLRMESFNLVQYLNMFILLVMTLFFMLDGPFQQTKIQRYVLLSLETRLKWYVFRVINMLMALICQFTILIGVYWIICFITLDRSFFPLDVLAWGKLIALSCYTFISGMLQIFVIVFIFQSLAKYPYRIYIMICFAILIFDLAVFYQGTIPFISIVNTMRVQQYATNSMEYIRLIPLSVTLVIGYFSIRKKEFS